MTSENIAKIDFGEQNLFPTLFEGSNNIIYIKYSLYSSPIVLRFLELTP